MRNALNANTWTCLDLCVVTLVIRQVVASTVLKFYMKRITRAAKLKQQLREAEKNVQIAISSGTRGRQLKLLKEAANILHKQVALIF